MKKLQAVLLAIVFPVSAIAQNAIPNYSFEDWESGGSVFNQYEEPEDWGTPNPTTVGFGFETATQTNNAEFVHSGASALRLETHHIGLLNIYAQGAAVTGNVEIDVLTQTVEVTGGVPFNLRPEALSGWHRYYPQGLDTAQVGMLLSRWNESTGVRDTVGIALYQVTQQVNDYSQFVVTFEYQMEEDPDTMLLGVICSSFYEPVEGSVMYVDDLELVYDPSSVFAPHSSKVLVYPNPARDQIWLDAPEAMAIRVFNTKGQIAWQAQIHPGENQLSVAQLSPGVYVLELVDVDGVRLGFSRLMIEQ